MKYNLLYKEMKQNLWKFIIGTILLTITAISLPLLYDIVIDMVGNVSEEHISRFLPDMSFIEDHNLYIWSQWHGKNLYQIGTILAIILGMNAVAGEVNNKTIGFLLTRPVSRSQVFITKTLAGAIWLALSVAFSTLVLILMASYEFGGIDIGRLLIATLITLLGLLVLYSFTLLLSVLIDEPIKVGAVSALIIFLLSVPGWFSATREYSIFTHLNAFEYFVEGNFPVGVVLIFIIMIFSFLTISVRHFSQKEF